MESVLVIVHCLPISVVLDLNAMQNAPTTTTSHGAGL